jgi:selenocysteine lyase/cysteine desulfurase
MELCKMDELLKWRGEFPILDYRPKAGVRLSPHFYNREEECDLAIAQIAEILETRAWEKHAAAYAHA